MNKSVKACPVCGKFPSFRYGTRQDKMEHICSSPRFSWSMNAGRALCEEFWNQRCENVARILEEEKQ